MLRNLAAKAYLNIPTQVTKAKMLVHLRDNGNIGGLMADSEIDTDPIGQQTGLRDV